VGRKFIAVVARSDREDSGEGEGHTCSMIHDAVTDISNSSVGRRVPSHFFDHHSQILPSKIGRCLIALEQ
jgi:hypothetical protein